MTAKIVLVTPPDDVLIDGARILLVNLDSEHEMMLSDYLKSKIHSNCVVYLAKSVYDFDWLIDKKQKSDYIIFNADHHSDLLNGYLAAQKNSAYFGTLKNLYRVNNNVIYTEEDLDRFFNNL